MVFGEVDEKQRDLVSFPWGLWLGVDMLGGVAMAAGGFIIASMGYLFHLERYRAVVRPAILTAFIGYLLAVIALIFDLGQLHRIWHSAVIWQVHSVMWVVAIHVILYTTTLALEFSPMLFERLGMRGAARGVHRIIVPVVTFGALLSVLHQSSLGAVFLIAEGKMSPLWYTPQIPKLFLVSAIMMGLAMVSFETIISPFQLRQLESMELWVDRLWGLVNFEVWYREDQNPCWVKWHVWQDCANRNPCEDPDITDCYVMQDYREQYRATYTLPKPPEYCESTSQQYYG